MINKIISFSIKHKLIIGLFTAALIGCGWYAIKHISLGAEPDITNNQVQIITVSPNLGTSDIEQFVTYPVELGVGNLPGVKNIRSISRFGLSVVTVVFEEKMGTYLPRQLVSEKLNEIRKEIPEKFGKPTMGPISTGLGEVYQYYLDVDSGYTYSDTTLRTIQDWIIKRQMAMLPGVVEVNSFGGHLKQYEVALNPVQLRNLGITVIEVYNAIKHNNGNTGSAYIEKNHKANFIRGEGLIQSLDDLRNIVLKTVDHRPVLVSDVATVKMGSAVRYGAFTHDGHEGVGGTVMMLKDAKPNKVIKRIKNRMTQIQTSLPEGVHIHPFLDRSDLISRTTHTISKNLIEGALIVIFVLILLLGNLRGGLIVASVIPLSLLFAFILMYLFGVDANLMSLGAIDFGILVDGAVIIVEGVIHLLDKRILKKKTSALSASKMDALTYKAGSKMMNAAFFGQLIILIVFLPILTLKGVEGKMFKPMALTFSFAVLGAMLLCLTYVPMVSSLFLRPRTSPKKSFFERLSQRIMNPLSRGYAYVIRRALKHWQWVIGIAVLGLLLAGLTFTRMGAVFIPSLDEGNIAMQAMLKPGTSLSETVEASQKIETILLQNFPEVKHVVARIGVSEIPTDPMPMDVADMFIILKPKKDGVSATHKTDLIRKMKEAIAVLPGINYQFSQPLELRFNELLTGVQEDIAIKIYGDDLKILAQKAQTLAGLIKDIDGVGDLNIEATQGLPQITIDYNRAKLAKYGLNINTLNRIISMANAGTPAGQVFEGEKKFAIVLRLDKAHRQNIDDIRNLYIPTANHQQIPLREVAEINYRPGPMQISRDATKRRIYVGINVRGRDVESLAHAIQEKVTTGLTLPPGYSITYGGEFENLKRAKKRLGVVVPIALVLIFILLYFSLKSFKKSAMIYTAIPLAAIGGVFSLYFREIPFSISAGVGFIVLFGVAVLNGLVLINSLNDLKEQGVTDLKTRIYEGTKQRLRPILLTAVSAIMGFTPMALSTSAGAEVQRPLATVVIGGLISASILTLIVIPVLYYLLERKPTSPMTTKTTSPKITFLFFLFFLGGSLGLSPQIARGQEFPQSMDSTVIATLAQAEKKALENNFSTQIARLKVKQRQQLEKTAVNLPPTTLYYEQEETKRHFPGVTSYGLQQEFAFPSVYGKQASLLKAKTHLAIKAQDLTQKQLIKQVRQAWYHLQNTYRRLHIYQKVDSLYNRFYQAAHLRYTSGATPKLSASAAKTEQFEIHLKRQKAQTQIRVDQARLQQLLNSKEKLYFPYNPHLKPPVAVTLKSKKGGLEENPELAYYTQKTSVAKHQTKLEKTKLWPSFSTQFGLQKVEGVTGFYTYQVGINIPLWFKPQRKRIKAAQTHWTIRQKKYQQKKQALNTRYRQLTEKYQQLLSVIQYYREQGLPLANQILKKNTMAYRQGEIGYVEYLDNIQRSLDLKENWLEVLNKYTQIVINLNYLLNP